MSNCCKDPFEVVEFAAVAEGAEFAAVAEGAARLLKRLV